MKKKFLIFAVVVLFSACNNEEKNKSANMKESTVASGESKQERNKKVVMASMEGFITNDLDKIFNDAASSYIDYADGSMAPVADVDSVKMFFKMLIDAIPDYKGENFLYLADGDHVAVIADWSGTFKNDLMGMKATGKPFKFKDVEIFKLNDEGKLTEHRSIANLGMVLQGSK